MCWITCFAVGAVLQLQPQLPDRLALRLPASPRCSLRASARRPGRASPWTAGISTCGRFNANGVANAGQHIGDRVGQHVFGQFPLTNWPCERPGIRPWSANLRKQIRQMPNLRYTARGRPHSWQRRSQPRRKLRRALRLWRSSIYWPRLTYLRSELVQVRCVAESTTCYFLPLELALRPGTACPSCVSSSRDSSSRRIRDRRT